MIFKEIDQLTAHVCTLILSCHSLSGDTRAHMTQGFLKILSTPFVSLASMFHRPILLVRLLGFLLLGIQSTTAFSQAPRLFINELVALQHQMVADPRGEYDDWIEIYNAEDTAVCIAGYFITDDFSKPQKVRIDEVFQQFTTIAPKGHLLLWLDKGTWMRPPVHLALKLNGEGEQVALFTPEGVLVDSVSFGMQKSGLSYARLGDGNPEWGFTQTYSPGATNALTAATFAPVPQFNRAGGIYEQPLQIVLSTRLTDAEIRYTTDGSTPSRTHGKIYNAPLSIDSTTAVRAGVFAANDWIETIATHTYVIGTDHRLPVVSLTTDSLDVILRTGEGAFFKGENLAHIEFFEADQTAFSIDAGFRLLGAAIRYYPQKSLGIRLRTEYGASTLGYSLFPQKPRLSNIHGFALRNSGNDNKRTLFRDGLMHTLISQGTGIDYVAYRPAVLYVNGRYWGIQNVREKISRHYVKENHGKKGKSLDLLEWKGSPIDGDEERFNAMWQYFSESDLSVPENYVRATSMIDLQNFIDYTIAQTFYGNTDWPMANIKYWRSRKSKGKWRWIMFDTDLAFELNKNRCPGHHNSIQYVMGENNCHLAHLDHALLESTTVFRSLMKNSSFQARFITRYVDLLNTNFQSEHVLYVIDSLQNLLADEMPRHTERWSEQQGIRSIGNWNREVLQLRKFAIERPDSIRQFLTEAFELGNPVHVTIKLNTPTGGTIRVNTIEPKVFPFQGVFFEQSKIRLIAIPAPGYRFVRWEELEHSSDRIEVLPTSKSYTAIFEKVE